MKIHIFYRHYNTEKSNERGKVRPEWFNYERCFINLINTIKNNNVDLHVIFDGNYKDNFIKKYYNYFTLHEINEKNDMGSFFKTCMIIKEQNIKDTDLIYILENDYLHVDNWIKKVNEFFESNSYLNYLTLYDHLDKYIFNDYENLTSKILITKTHHWRTTPSTCGSFIMKKKLFDLDFDIQSTFVGDNQKFIKLKKERNRDVISPIPGLSTHCSYDLLSPTINWEKINKKTHE